MERITLEKSKVERPAAKSPIATKYKEIDLVPTQPQQKISEDEVISLENCASLAIPQFDFESDYHPIVPLRCNDNRNENEELRLQRRKQKMFLKKDSKS